MREESKKRMDMYVCVYIHPVYIQYVCVCTYIYMCVCVKVKVTQYCPTLCDLMDYTIMEFSRPEYWMGSLSLLQGIFLIQGSNPGLRITGGFFTS